jgi:hypothetical protein
MDDPNDIKGRTLVVISPGRRPLGRFINGKLWLDEIEISSRVIALKNVGELKMSQTKPTTKPEPHSWIYGSQRVECAICGTRKCDATPDDDCHVIAFLDSISGIPKPGYMGDINGPGCDPDCP